MENMMIYAQSPDAELACNDDALISQLLASAIGRA